MTKEQKLQVINNIFKVIKDNMPKKRWYWFDRPGCKYGLCRIVHSIYHLASTPTDSEVIDFLEESYCKIYKIEVPGGYWWFRTRIYSEITAVYDWYKPRIEFLHQVKELVLKDDK